MSARDRKATEQATRHRVNWEDLGALDPLFAILSEPGRQFGGWDIDEFFARGVEEVDAVLAAASRHGLPVTRARALDFGCGVGRVTRALASHFAETVGVDISQQMLDRARLYNQDQPNCRFLHNDQPHLHQFGDGQFDFVYSNIALQHVPERSHILQYIQEFVRILRPEGIAVFQLPSHLRVKNRLQLRPRLYEAFRRAGASPQFLYERLGLHPIVMRFVPEAHVRVAIAGAGGRVLEVQSRPVSSTISTVYFVVRSQA